MRKGTHDAPGTHGVDEWSNADGIGRANRQGKTEEFFGVLPLVLPAKLGPQFSPLVSIRTTNILLRN